VVLDLFEDLGVAYMIGGSLASSIHGEPRATNDFDIVADVTLGHVARIVAVLEAAAFYVSEDAMRDSIRRRSSFNAIHGGAVKIDVFVSGDREWDRVSLSRRLLVDYPGHPGRRVFVRTAEDIILKKLEWFRLGGEVSERQWRDVTGVIRVRGPELDQPYLQQWAPALGVRDLLDRAVRETIGGFPGLPGSG
jgi:hypothetical protein